MMIYLLIRLNLLSSEIIFFYVPIHQYQIQVNSRTKNALHKTEWEVRVLYTGQVMQSPFKSHSYETVAPRCSLLVVYTVVCLMRSTDRAIIMSNA